MQGKFGMEERVVGKSPASEFILSTYNPRVAVFSTPAAAEIASKNNLTLPQLFAPFTRVQTDGKYKLRLAKTPCYVTDFNRAG